MLKIATHDSATGEKGMFYCLPLEPFVKTQSKTIRDQYDAGCRSFDIRVKKHAGTWRCAHGWWFTRRSALDIFKEIDTFPERCQVCITYEGRAIHNDEFLQFVGIIKSTFTNIIYGNIAIKYGKMEGTKFVYTNLEKHQEGYEGGKQGFLPLNGGTWHSLIPIPWLWDRIYKRPHVFNEETFTYVDFL